MTTSKGSARGNLGWVAPKIRRAEEHLKCLRDKISTWKDAQTNVPITDEVNAERTEYTISRTFTEAPDVIGWGVRLGDFAHCLRSGLNHAAYQLAITASGIDPPPNEKRVEFPIFDSRDGFRTWRRGVSGAYVPRGCVAVLESVQPYPRRKRPYLGLVHAINNEDKHRIIKPVPMKPSSVTFSPGKLGQLGIVGFRSQYASDFSAVRITFYGTDVMPPGTGPMDMQTRVTIGIGFEVGGLNWLFEPTGREMFNEVDRVIGALSLFL